ncbi:hypothetical protein CPC08DRAFT_516409 [Agrocybe pediades]|nr:hypothetical protein CPC08DRAFT_516409 [Agrocybe pediades]
MLSDSLTRAELGQIAGPMLIGYILNWGFFGILGMQVYVYYLAFPKDSARKKALVYILLILEAAQTIIFTSSAFNIFATGFGDAAVLDRVDLLWFSVPVMSGLVAFVAEVYYASRIASFSYAEKKYLSGLVTTLAVLQFGGAIALGVQTKNAILYNRLIGSGPLITSTIWQSSSLFRHPAKGHPISQPDQCA